MRTGRGHGLLRLSFAIGTVADAFVAVNWFLIASGAAIPNLMCGFLGTGEAYRFAMYIAGLFMTGWAVILAWGFFDPYPRRGLLLITAALLLVSIPLEAVFFTPPLGGSGFLLGVGLRVALIAKFTTSCLYARPGPDERG